MTDINELRRKVNSTDVVDHIDLQANIKPFLSELLDRLEEAEKDIALKERIIDSLGSALNVVVKERDVLLARIREMERQEPVGVLHVGSYYGEELEDWEFEANQCACDKLNEAYVHNPTSLPLYALPGAKGE